MADSKKDNVVYYWTAFGTLLNEKITESKPGGVISITQVSRPITLRVTAATSDGAFSREAFIELGKQAKEIYRTSAPDQKVGWGHVSFHSFFSHGTTDPRTEEVPENSKRKYRFAVGYNRIVGSDIGAIEADIITIDSFYSHLPGRDIFPDKIKELVSGRDGKAPCIQYVIPLGLAVDSEL